MLCKATSDLAGHVWDDILGFYYLSLFEGLNQEFRWHFIFAGFEGVNMDVWYGMAWDGSEHFLRAVFTNS